MASLAGTLNASVTAGKKTPVDFRRRQRRHGADPQSIFHYQETSDKWTVEFKPDKIDALNPGEVREIKMEILAPDRTIAGRLSAERDGQFTGNEQVGGFSRHGFDADRSGAGSASPSSP